MKLVRYTLLTLGGIPLLIYPAVLVADVMSLAGHRTGKESFLLVFMAYSFILGSLAYPGVYITCLLSSRTQAKKDARRSLWIATGPLVYLLLLILLIVIWVNIGG